MSDMLHHDRFTRFGASHNKRPLPFTDGRKDVENATGDIFIAFDISLEAHALVRMQRSQVLKHNSMFDGLGLHAVDLVDFDQGEITFAIFWRADLALDRVPSVKVKAANLRRGDINIVCARQIRGFWGAQKAKTIG